VVEIKRRDQGVSGGKDETERFRLVLREAGQPRAVIEPQFDPTPVALMHDDRQSGLGHRIDVAQNGARLARISKGRSVREFIVGCVFAPAFVCFAWMTILGGTAIDLELTGGADGAIVAASNTAKLFVTLEQMIEGGLLSALTVMCVVLILTFLVTSADSGILVMNTIMSGGDQDVGNKHKIIWGLILTAVIGALILAAGENNPMDALRNAMIIGALPFTMVMGLMCVALAKALYRDGKREKLGTLAAAKPAE
jgi:choline-glycine betaine transporter